LEIGKEYGDKYAGTYFVKALTWAEIRSLIRSLGASKDRLEYVEQLVAMAVSGPVPITKESLGSLPGGLLLKLIDEVARLNDIGRQEANFLQSLPTAAQQPQSQTRASS
jgi:hypothetical protein